MKKLNALFLSLLLIFNFAVCMDASADAASAVQIQLTVGNPYMTVNGAYAEIDPGNGTVPVIADRRTLVPIRAIVEALGGSVAWDDYTQTATLFMGDDTVSLVIGSSAAMHNGTTHYLDVAPDIINGRTMLPIRFVAESFGLGVHWDGVTQTVTVSKNSLQPAGKFSLDSIPPYSGSPYVAVNGNVPMFTANEITAQSFESYSPLDSLGRCGVCVASISLDIMPSGERGDISSVMPTGWQSIKYDNVDGGYLYNRCHLIGFQLTAENANPNNLITGTRYLNVEGMLPFENMVADYIKETGNHVMYRATTAFEGNNLLASGVLLEGYSVEDSGAGISFCVYCYNVQPGITVNYATGSSSVQYDSAQPVYSQSGQSYDNSYSSQASPAHPYGYYILNTNSKKYHEPSCGTGQKTSNQNKATSTLSSAELRAQGYTPCGNCFAK